MACSALSAIEQEGVNRLFGEFVTRFPQVLHSFSADRILFAFDALQYTYLPAVFSAGHDGNIVNLRLVGMDDGCAVEDLRLDAGSIAELNRGAIDGIKDRLHFVAVVDDVRLQSMALLVFHALAEPVKRKADKVFVQRSG